MSQQITEAVVTDVNAGRTRCEIFSRVMGYFRPVSQYNHGKKSEFYSRKNFIEHNSMNSQFIAKFGS